jgi:hypothetical protein
MAKMKMNQTLVLALVAILAALTSVEPPELVKLP